MREKKVQTRAKLALTFTVLVVLAGVGLACTFLYRPHSDHPATSMAEENQLDSFVQEWNENAGAVSARFHLTGTDTLTPASIVERLQGWCEPFHEPLPKDFLEQLDQLSYEAPATPFHRWKKLAEDRYNPVPITLNPEMTTPELATALNSYLGIVVNERTPDYITPETVWLIAARNRFCDYFEHERDKLRKEGIAFVYECERLSPHGNYPALDRMTRE